VEVAILVFTIIAAVGGIAAVVTLWRQREHLELTFREGFTDTGTSISVPCRVENAGQSPIYNIELFTGPPGITLDRAPFHTLTLQPGVHHSFWIDLGRPTDAEVEPGDTTPTLRAPRLIIARHGRRLTVTEMPAGRYDPGRAKTKTHRRSTSF
jgi:hypothetical protein